MASVNKWIGIGNLGADPEMSYLPNGDAVANIRIACTESWKEKTTGEKKELTEWVRVVFYRKLAEIVGQYLKKGSSVYVEGRMRTRKWQTKDGEDRYTTEIEANEMQMLGGRSECSRTASEGAGGSTSYAPKPEAQRAAQSGPVSPGFDDMTDDEIPF